MDSESQPTRERERAANRDCPSLVNKQYMYIRILHLGTRDVANAQEFGVRGEYSEMIWL